MHAFSACVCRVLHTFILTRKTCMTWICHARQIWVLKMLANSILSIRMHMYMCEHTHTRTHAHTHTNKYLMCNHNHKHGCIAMRACVCCVVSAYLCNVHTCCTCAHERRHITDSYTGSRHQHTAFRLRCWLDACVVC